MTEPTLFFFTVKDAASKIRALTETVQSHLVKKEKIHVIVPDLSTLEFVDLLLWNHPKESFRPHSKEALLPFQDLIFLSLPFTSLDPFPVVFNLCQTAYIPTHPIKILYELEDLTHPQKAALFQNKFQAYQKAGFKICSAIR